MRVVGGVEIQSAGRETVVQWNGKSTIQFRTLNCCWEIFFLYAWIMPSNWASRWHVHLLFFDNTQQQEPKKKKWKCKICYKMRWFSGKRRLAMLHSPLPQYRSTAMVKVCNWIKLIILMTLMKCLITDGGVFFLFFIFCCHST